MVIKNKNTKKIYFFTNKIIYKKNIKIVVVSIIRYGNEIRKYWISNKFMVMRE